MVETNALAYLHPSATDLEWETHIHRVLSQSEPVEGTHCSGEALWSIHIQKHHEYTFVLNTKSRKETKLAHLWFHYLSRLDVPSFPFICLGSCSISIVSTWSQKTQQKAFVKNSKFQTVNAMGLWYSATEQHSTSLMYTDGKDKLHPSQGSRWNNKTTLAESHRPSAQLCVRVLCLVKTSSG